LQRREKSLAPATNKTTFAQSSNSPVTTPTMLYQLQLGKHAYFIKCLPYSIVFIWNIFNVIFNKKH